MTSDDTPTTDGVAERRTTAAAVSHYSRRAVLGTAAVTALAGCLGGSDDDNSNDTNATDNQSDNGTDVPDTRPVVEDPPDAVYTPTHTAPMEMIGMVEAGSYMLMPHFSLPHRFWLTRSGSVEEVAPKLDDSAHMMLAFWDGETGQSIPVDIGATLTVRQDGDRVTQVAPWAMISQQMGFHLGDNVALPEDGTYTGEVTIPPIDVRKTGAFAGRFEETQTATFEFGYTTETTQQLTSGVEYIEESRWGEPGALDPMQMGNRPSPSLPPAEEYPGQPLVTADGETPTSDDAQFVVRYLSESRLADGNGYLLVSPRTPYNRIPIPEMALSLSGGRDAELTQTLDGDLGLHYGTPLSLSPGETFDIVVESPPQVARHQGYETALIEMEPMTVQLDDSQA